MASVSANGAQIKVLQTKRDSSAAVISRVPPASEAEVVLVDRALPKPIISSGSTLPVLSKSRKFIVEQREI